jgi:hypothetical protein
MHCSIRRITGLSPVPAQICSVLLRGRHHNDGVATGAGIAFCAFGSGVTRVASRTRGAGIARVAGVSGIALAARGPGVTGVALIARGTLRPGVSGIAGVALAAGGAGVSRIAGVSLRALRTHGARACDQTKHCDQSH